MKHQKAKVSLSQAPMWTVCSRVASQSFLTLNLYTIDKTIIFLHLHIYSVKYINIEAEGGMEGLYSQYPIPRLSMACVCLHACVHMWMHAWNKLSFKWLHFNCTPSLDIYQVWNFSLVALCWRLKGLRFWKVLDFGFPDKGYSTCTSHCCPDHPVHGLLIFFCYIFILREEFIEAWRCNWCGHCFYHQTAKAVCTAGLAHPLGRKRSEHATFNA